ncbi:MAG: hypothetical protein ACFCVK_11985 [Acidimicrobiales bacterium]
MNEDEARALAANHADTHLADLEPTSWRVTAFDGGWYLVPQGDHLRWRTGVIGLVVTDDGAVHEESTSQPPSIVIDRYRRAP